MKSLSADAKTQVVTGMTSASRRRRLRGFAGAVGLPIAMAMRMLTTPSAPSTTSRSAESFARVQVGR
jgi:hypothetical protein